jgi:comEA protein
MRYSFDFSGISTKKKEGKMKARVFILLVVVVMSMFVVGSVITMAQEAKKTPAPKEKTQKKDEETEAKKIDVNSATQEELETLPGIGPKYAQAIIEGRPYEKVEDLLRVKGIGEKTLAKLKDLVEAKPIEKQEKETKKTTKQSKKKDQKKTETKPKK